MVTRVEENRQPAAAVSGAEVRALLVDLFCCYCILAVESTQMGPSKIDLQNGDFLVKTKNVPEVLK